MINIKEDDLWNMLLSTVRYSMGRKTYMSVYARELVARYNEALSTDQLLQIVQEIQSEIESHEKLGKTLGMQIDHDEWRKTVLYLRNLAYNR